MADNEDIIDGVSIHHSVNSIWLRIRIGDVQSVSERLDNTIECVDEDFKGEEGEIEYWDELYLNPEDAISIGAALIKLGNKLGARNYTEAEISLGLIRLGKCIFDSPVTPERRSITIREVKLYPRTEAHCEHFKLYLNGSNQSPQCGTCTHWTPTDQYV